MYPQFLVSEYNHPLYVLILYVEIWKVQKQKKTFNVPLGIADKLNNLFKSGTLNQTKGSCNIFSMLITSSIFVSVHFSSAHLQL